MKNRIIFKSISKIIGILLLVVSIGLNTLAGTGAWFTSSLAGEDSEVQTGCWEAPSVPVLLSPANNSYLSVTNQTFNWQSVTSTCPTAIISYQYQAYTDPGLTSLYFDSGWIGDTSVTLSSIPEGDYYWHVRAKDQFDHTSNFSAPWLLIVDRTAPYVKINNPLDGQTVSGTVDIRGTVTDAHPHHYWLAIQRVADSSYVYDHTTNDSNSFTNQHLYNWDTTTIPNGNYVIKLEARDAAGNKNPNLAPVPSDPENPTDSVDWITVTVKNTPLVYTVGTWCGSGYTPVLKQTLTIQGNDVDGESVALTGGQTYQLEAQGTFQHTPGAPNTHADAGYTTDNNWASIRTDIGISPSAPYRGAGALVGNLGSGVGIIPWGSYTPTHNYVISYTPSSSITARFLISDWYGYWYSPHRCDNQACISNNTGNLTVNVYQCQQINAGDVVINELMWMGSTTSENDEWIELRNTKNYPIDLSGWQLTSLVGTSDTETLMLTIPSGKTIPANGYFLISNFNEAGSAMSVVQDLVDTDVVLRNDDLQIKLYKGSWTNVSNLIDTADDGSGTPLAGVNSTDKQSMERNNDPATGWHTCNNVACNDTAYWDTEGNNYGTPKAANLSTDDPTSPDYLQTSVDFYLRPDRKAVGFKVTGISPYKKLEYEITYSPTNRESQGIIGTVDLSGENELVREDLILGTDSSGDWVYDVGMDKIYLKVKLSGDGISDRILEKELDY